MHTWIISPIQQQISGVYLDLLLPNMLQEKIKKNSFQKTFWRIDSEKVWKKKFPENHGFLKAITKNLLVFGWLNKNHGFEE